MRQVIIIDHFYSDPDYVRSVALGMQYVPKGLGSYPGQNSVEKFLPPGMNEVIMQKIGVPVEQTPRSAHGIFRIQFKNDVFQQWIHADVPADWGGVLYLNPGTAPGGTAFWKHKETDLVFYPSAEECNKFGIDPKKAHEKFNVTDGLKAELWDQELMVEAKYNRLILFPAKAWHSHMPIESFGDTRENARLVQLFFFNNKK